MKTIAWAIVLSSFMGVCTWSEHSLPTWNADSAKGAGVILIILFVGFVMCALGEGH